MRHLRGDRAQPRVRRTQGPSFPGFFSWPPSSSISDASRPLQQPWLHHPCTPLLFQPCWGGGPGAKVSGGGEQMCKGTSHQGSWGSARPLGVGTSRGGRAGLAGNTPEFGKKMGEGPFLLL